MMHGQFKVPALHAEGPGLAPGQDGAKKFNPRQILSLFLRRWPTVLGLLAVVLALAALRIVQTVPIYTAAAQVLIDPRKERVFAERQIVSELGMDVSSIATEVGVITSFSVARRVVEKLKLDEHPAFGGAKPTPSFIESVWNFFSFEDDKAPSVGVADPKSATGAKGQITAALLGSILAVQAGTTARRVGPSFFIEITHSNSDPVMAATIANAISEAYLLDQLEARFQASRRAATWLSERVSEVRKQLTAAEQLLAEHRARYNLLKPQAGTLADQQAAEINGQLVAARSQTVEKKAKYDQAQRLLDGGAGIENVASVMDSPVIAGLRAQDADLARQEADQLTRYGPEHPTIVKIRAERSDLRRQVNREVSRVVQTLKTDFEFALKKEQSLEESIRELIGGDDRTEQPVIRLRELERDVESSRILYDSMLQRFKEAEQQTSVNNAESRITAPALRPNVPSYPNRKRIILMALALGLAAGFGAAMLLEYLESGFLSAEQAEQALRLPVLAMVPDISAKDRTIEKRTLKIPEYVLAKPMSEFGEAIRSIRVGIQMSNVDKPPKVILVTSAQAAEGKTSLLLTLSHSSASAGQRTLVIDCDLRHPTSSKYFNLQEAPGLTDYLAGQTPIEAVMRRTTLANLSIISAGSSTRHAPDILGSDRFRSLLASLRDHYDAIYIDAPPLAPVVDGAVLARLADKVILVVKWRTTPRDIVERSLKSVDDPRQKMAGIAINMSEVNTKRGYSQYGGNHAYHKYYTQ
ncbi:MAG: polysaccharide biosynthesis tyrosine autokinase [Hyphomicrobium sp.]